MTVKRLFALPIILLFSFSAFGQNSGVSQVSDIQNEITSSDFKSMQIEFNSLNRVLTVETNGESEVRIVGALGKRIGTWTGYGIHRIGVEPKYNSFLVIVKDQNGYHYKFIRQ